MHISSIPKWWRFPVLKPIELPSTSPGGVEGCPLDGGCQDIIRKAWPCNIISVDFCKIGKVHCSSYNTYFSSLPNFSYFSSGSRKWLPWLTHPSVHFYIHVLTHPSIHFYIHVHFCSFIYWWTCFRPEYRWYTAHWMLSNNQSIPKWKQINWL